MVIYFCLSAWVCFFCLETTAEETSLLPAKEPAPIASPENLAAPIAPATLPEEAPLAQFSGEAVPILLDAFEVFPEKWRAKAFIAVPFYTFYLGAPKVDGVAFLPNFNPELGVSLGYKGFILKTTQPFQVLPDYESSRRGESNKQEYILSISLHRFAIDLYSQYYRGFYISTPVTSLLGGQPEKYAQLPDTQVHNAGINVYFAFHPESYSMAAAFAHTEFQFKSGGSALAHMYINRLDLNPGSQFIAGTAPGANVKPDIYAGTFWSTGAAGGYGHTFSFKRYFITGQGMLGLGPQYQKLSDKDGSYDRLNIQMKINATLALGMNRRFDYAGIQAMLDSIYGQIRDGQLASSLVSTFLYYGRRF